MIFITKENGDKVPIEPCPYCDQTKDVVHDYFAGCSYDFHWVVCENEECEDSILNELDTVKEPDYQKGKERAVAAWNDYCLQKRQEHKEKSEL